MESGGLFFNAARLFFYVRFWCSLARMYFFDDFMEEDLALIVSLPYRVGAWIGGADDVEGDGDDRKEERALLSVLQGITREEKAAPFVSAVVDQTLTYRHMWDEWKALESRIISDLEKALRLMEARLPDENIKNYKEMLLRIARVVAQAAGEFEGGEAGGGMMSRLLERFSDPLADEPENISAAEAAALQKLKETLKA